MNKKTIPLFKVFMDEHAGEEVSKVLNSGYIGQGVKVEEFEKILRDYFNYDYILTTNSGTSGLHLALRLLKDKYINSENEILATSLTCTASNLPIIINGFKIKWVDTDPKTLNMDLDDFARKITRNTKAAIIPFWGGCPIDNERLNEILDITENMYGFRPIIIQDAAHAMGARYKGDLVGTYGHITMFSLQAIKHITSVDGGLLFLSDKELYRRGKLIRWYGIDRETDRKDFRCEAPITEKFGDKLHMNDINATIGIQNFRHIDEILNTNRNIAKYYDENLKNISGIQLLEQPEHAESAHWLYSMHVENRGNFSKYMKECQIVTSRVHERNDNHPILREYITQLPNLEKIIKTMICIPIGWWVTDEDKEYIVDCIKKGW
jgi:dTDP-4-amino-4,6-dideoxygalactose transaminase